MELLEEAGAGVNTADCGLEEIVVLDVVLDASKCCGGTNTTARGFRVLIALGTTDGAGEWFWVPLLAGSS